MYAVRGDVVMIKLSMLVEILVFILCMTPRESLIHVARLKPDNLASVEDQ